MTACRRSLSFAALASAAALGLLAPAQAGADGARQQLPIYFEDNHAGTFEFLATTLDLDLPHVLVLVDAHSDASSPRRLEELRSGIRRVATPEQRTDKIRAWRRAGDVQAFDWIQGLMPLPVAKVVWVRPAADAGDDAQVGTPLPRGFALAPPEALVVAASAELPQVVSIDLDTFTGLQPSARAARFHAIWEAVLQLPRLAGVSFAISRPWLATDEEASDVVTLALKASLALPYADIRFEAFGIEGPDRSERAKDYYRQHQEPVRFDPETASPELRSLLLANESRLRADVDPSRWRALLERWRAEGSDWQLAMVGVQADSDGILRPGNGAAADLRVEGGPPGSVHRVTWYRWTPRATAYNVLPELPAGKVFAGAAPPLMEYESAVIAVTDSPVLEAEAWARLLPGPGRTGVLRVSAELETTSGLAHTAKVEIRKGAGEGFRAGLSEQFGLPYVFGAGFLRRGALRGPDTGVGNDCANFLVYAWRRSGVRMPWSNPAQLRRFLQLQVQGATADGAVPVPDDAQDRGFVVHLGAHVAALWEDRPPLGILGPEDLVVHHLGGLPEAITLAQLLKGRDRPTFDVYLGPSREPAAWVAIGGDVMPGDGEDMRPEVAAALREADLAVVNLETTVGAEGQPAQKRYVFRTGPGRLEALRGAGVRAVSLANNHAGDFGEAGLKGTLSALTRAGLGHFGAGADASAAVTAWYGRARGQVVAFISVSLTDQELLPAGEGAPGISVGQRHRQALADALESARRKAQTVVVVPHWGEEGTTVITDEQRAWARWFVDHGADAVVGSGPHVIQEMETVAGVPVVYSVGNLWFRGEWPPAARRAGVALIGIDKEGRVVATRLERH